MDKYNKTVDFYTRLAEKEIAHGIKVDYVTRCLGEKLDAVRMVASFDDDLSSEDFMELARKIWKIKYNEEMPEHD